MGYLCPDSFGRSRALAHPWKGLLAPFCVQKVPSPHRPMTLSREQTTSFIKDRELFAPGPRSEPIETTRVTESHPQGAPIRSSHELHKVIIRGSQRHGRRREMARLQEPHATHQDRPRNSEQRAAAASTATPRAVLNRDTVRLRAS